MEKSEDRFLFLNKQFLDAAADPAPPTPLKLVLFKRSIHRVIAISLTIHLG